MVNPSRSVPLLIGLGGVYRRAGLGVPSARPELGSTNVAAEDGSVRCMFRRKKHCHHRDRGRAVHSGPYLRSPKVLRSSRFSWNSKLLWKLRERPLMVVCEVLSIRLSYILTGSASVAALRRRLDPARSPGRNPACRRHPRPATACSERKGCLDKLEFCFPGSACAKLPYLLVGCLRGCKPYAQHPQCLSAVYTSFAKELLNPARKP